jgi:hypothetical protein
MSLTRFEPAIPAIKGCQTYALDRTAIFRYRYFYLVRVLQKSGPTSYSVFTVILLSHGGLKFPRSFFEDGTEV